MLGLVFSLSVWLPAFPDISLSHLSLVVSLSLLYIRVLVLFVFQFFNLVVLVPHVSVSLKIPPVVTSGLINEPPARLV